MGRVGAGDFGRASLLLSAPRFKPTIDEITFPSASQGSRRIIFVTERCVMELSLSRLLVATKLRCPARGSSSEISLFRSPTAGAYLLCIDGTLSN